MSAPETAAAVADRLEDGPVWLVRLAREAARRGDRDKAKSHLAEAQQTVAAVIAELAESPNLDIIREALGAAPLAPPPDAAQAASAEGAFDFALDQALAIYDHLVSALRKADG